MVCDVLMVVVVTLVVIKVIKVMVVMVVDDNWNGSGDDCGGAGSDTDNGVARGGDVCDGDGSGGGDDGGVILLIVLVM